MTVGKQLPASDQKIDHGSLPWDRSGSDETVLPECVRSLTHDLRTPLTALKSCLNLLLRGEAGDLTVDQQRFLSMAGRNIDRLDRMVEDILVSSRIRCPETALKRREVDLGPLLAENVRLHGVIAAERGVEVESSGIPNSFPAIVDPDRVVRILDNILGNALKFTPREGLVRIWLEEGAGSPRSLASRLARHFQLPLATFNLIVEVSGPGLCSAVQSRIFEPFIRGPEGGGPKRSGTGLGLSFTRGVAETHGGQVRLASLPGRGATVWLKLPRDPASDILLRSVDQLQEALFAGPRSAVQPLVGVIDLRQGETASGSVDPELETFLSQGAGGTPQGWELTAGLWVAAVMDPVNWNRRWTLHTARLGGGLEATRWEFLASDTRKTAQRPALAGNQEERRETMVNPAPSVPIII